MSEFVRITWELGGERHTAWSRRRDYDSLKDAITFKSLESGSIKAVSHSTPYVVTFDVGSLPPRVKEAMDDV